MDERAFKDARLGRRFADILKQLGDGVRRSIPFAYQDWAIARASINKQRRAAPPGADRVSRSPGLPIVVQTRRLAIEGLREIAPRYSRAWTSRATRSPERMAPSM